MKRTTRLGYLLELVLVIAIAMALSRAAYRNHDWSGPPISGWWGFWWTLCFLVEPFLSGVALAGGAGLAIEMTRRRSPPAWGWGRWTWSVSCLVVLMGFGGNFCVVVIWLLRQSSPPPASEVLYNNLMGYWSNQFSNTILLALVPALITARLARVPTSSSPDGREWAGRAFAVFAVLWASVFQIMPLFT